MPGKPPPSSHRLHVRQLVSLSRRSFYVSALRQLPNVSSSDLPWKASRGIFAVPQRIMGDARVKEPYLASEQPKQLWAHEDLNLGPLPCQGMNDMRSTCTNAA